jgi:6-phosphogluconolactonase
MSIHIFPSKADAVLALAERISDVARMSIHANKRFSFVLSGGKTPELLYETLAAPPFSEGIDWSRVFFFLGDERYVPVTDDDSNYKMIKEKLFAPLKIKEEQIYEIDTSLSAEKAANRYQRIVQDFFKRTDIVFNFTLLGLGDNAHTASLFPGTEVLYDKTPAIKPVTLKENNSRRITMNAPLINQSQHIAFLVSGAEKAQAVHQVLEGNIDWRQYPAQLIRKELVDWYLDEPAAKDLELTETDSGMPDFDKR